MNKKIIVPTLAMIMGAGLVGSISGTVAWYQYSTRATIQMLGASLGVDRNLQVAITDASATEAPAADDTTAWKTEIKTNDIKTALSWSKVELQPATPDAAYVKNEAFGAGVKFRTNPKKYQENVTTWREAGATDVASFKLWVRAYENETETLNLVSKKLGLLDLTIKKDATDTTKQDLSGAIRVAITNVTDDKTAIFAKGSSSTVLHGNLDLDNDGVADKEYGYDEDPSLAEPLKTLDYGIDGGTGTTYNLGSDAVLCTEGSLANGKDTITGGLDLGSTSTSAPIALKVTIWVEGWHSLGGSTLWSVKDYANAKFFLGMTIASGYTA